MTLGLSCNFSPFKIILPDSAKRSKFECLFTVNTLVDHSKSVWCETMSLARNPVFLLSYSSWNAHPSRVWWLPVSQTLSEILHTVHSTQRCKILTCRIRYMARLGRIGYIAGLFLFLCLCSLVRELVAWESGGNCSLHTQYCVYLKHFIDFTCNGTLATAYLAMSCLELPERSCAVTPACT